MSAGVGAAPLGTPQKPILLPTAKTGSERLAAHWGNWNCTTAANGVPQANTTWGVGSSNWMGHAYLLRHDEIAIGGPERSMWDVYSDYNGASETLTGSGPYLERKSDGQPRWGRANMSGNDCGNGTWVWKVGVDFASGEFWNDTLVDTFASPTQFVRERARVHSHSSQTQHDSTQCTKV